MCFYGIEEVYVQVGSVLVHFLLCVIIYNHETPDSTFKRILLIKILHNRNVQRSIRNISRDGSWYIPNNSR